MNNKSSHQLRQFAFVLLCLTPIFLAFTSLAPAQTFDLVYGVISAGGGSSTSTNFSVDSIITTTGVGADQSSSSYSVDSVLDADPEPPAAVDEWMLF